MSKFKVGDRVIYKKARAKENLTYNLFNSFIPSSGNLDLVQAADLAGHLIVSRSHLTKTPIVGEIIKAHFLGSESENFKVEFRFNGLTHIINIETKALKLIKGDK
jgi:hypothetical protein